MPNVDFLPSSTEDRQTAFLAFSAVLGGGVIAYEAARSIREGDLLKTDALPKKPEAGVVAMGGGLVLLGAMLHEASKEYGWKPIVLGGAAISAFAVIGRVLRR